MKKIDTFEGQNSKEPIKSKEGQIRELKALLKQARKEAELEKLCGKCYHRESQRPTQERVAL